MTIAKQSLLNAAKAVLDASARNHLRKHHLDAMRQAVQAAGLEYTHEDPMTGVSANFQLYTRPAHKQDVPVYTPLTDDDFHKIASENIDEMNASGWLNLYEVYGKVVERAVIELGDEVA